MARDGFSKLLAAGLTAVFALQAVVIIGGVVRLIPLTGVTLPFVSFGGSSVIANMILLGLLLMISNDARRPRPRRVSGQPTWRRCPHELPRSSASTASCCSCSRRWSGSRPTGPCSTPTTSRTIPQNRRPLIVEQTVKRGTIKTADGVTVAESSPVGGGKHPVYVRNYPQGSEFGNPVGYSFIEVGRTGIERSENGFLAGERNEFTSIIDQLRDVPQEGDDVTLTIDSQAQRVATQALAVGDRLDRRGERGAAEPWSRSTPPPARSRRWPRCPASTPTGQGHRRLQAAQQGQERAARQPAHPEHLPARLDDEGGHRRRGARLGRVHARARCSAGARRR